MVQVDTQVILGVGVGVAGVAAGVGLMAFQDNQVARAEARGSDVVSDVTKTKLSAQFMEDVEMGSVGLDDTVSKMERAIAKRKGLKVEELEAPVARDVIDDGW